MKSIYTLAAVAVLVAGAANAQPKKVDACADNLIANSKIIARAQAAETPAKRMAILKEAIDANPGNAVCLADLALQMSLAAGVNPAAGPEEFGTGDVPTTTDGTEAPAENPSQLNQPTGTDTSSPAQPTI